MKGRDKCELLNEVRQKIAEKNDIEFTVYECTFEGDCTGTCPKCESEVRYLEEELTKKQARGEKINLEGIFNIEETCSGYIEEPPTEEGDGRGTYELLGTPLIEEPLNEIGEDELTELLGKPFIEEPLNEISEDKIIELIDKLKVDLPEEYGSIIDQDLMGFPSPNKNKVTLIKKLEEDEDL